VTEIYLIKHADGAFRPALEADVEAMRRFKVGKPVKVEMKEVRNWAFLKKTMVLFREAYDFFCEHNLSEKTYKGQKVIPDFTRFRKDLIILAGHYKATFDIRGNIRLQAKSLSYANCSQEQSERIYQDVITAAMANVYRTALTEEQLRAHIDSLLHFT
jgi:hypothetical protein